MTLKEIERKKVSLDSRGFHDGHNKTKQNKTKQNKTRCTNYVSITKEDTEQYNVFVAPLGEKCARACV